jgi:hypothetical protein
MTTTNDHQASPQGVVLGLRSDTIECFPAPLISLSCVFTAISAVTTATVCTSASYSPCKTCTIAFITTPDKTIKHLCPFSSRTP